ncbi:antibiotic biosynthesis monooxygenase family protein [Sandaracinus amylolyticus]|uniref:antibiotic biosynthesis monooxygenase family protein n=1 Tax=Sandaracinus amylolyticus TaxID=927083 RepID=UPI001F3101A3|nr:antibiotic biosynthesis monooxygenase [Sandaracinus amylolyticus]UJR80289.1 Antibiotic biosynthesis monooxygenase [Sandaracinus amylolyticus]
MIVAISRFSCEATEADEIERRFRARSKLVDGHLGFLGLEVLRSIGARPEFALVTRWESRAALGAYLKSDDFRAVHAEGEEQDAVFTLYEQVAT